MTIKTNDDTPYGCLAFIFFGGCSMLLGLGAGLVLLGVAQAFGAAILSGMIGGTVGLLVTEWALK